MTNREGTSGRRRFQSRSGAVGPWYLVHECQVLGSDEESTIYKKAPLEGACPPETPDSTEEDFRMHKFAFVERRNGNSKVTNSELKK